MFQSDSDLRFDTFEVGGTGGFELAETSAPFESLQPSDTVAFPIGETVSPAPIGPVIGTDNGFRAAVGLTQPFDFTSRDYASECPTDACSLRVDGGFEGQLTVTYDFDPAPAPVSTWTQTREFALDNKQVFEGVDDLVSGIFSDTAQERFSKFDPALGTLLGVDVTVTGTGDVAFETLDGDGVPIDDHGPEAGPPLGGGVSFDENPFNAVGQSGGAAFPVSQTVFFDANELAFFLGTDNHVVIDPLFTVDYDFDLRELLQRDCAGGVCAVRTSGGFEGEIALRYHFAGAAAQSVPEPGVLALFGIGLAGLGWMRRRSAA